MRATCSSLGTNSCYWELYTDISMAKWWHQCGHVYIHVYVSTYTHMYVYIYIYMYTFKSHLMTFYNIHIYIYIHTYIFIYIHTYIRPHTKNTYTGFGLESQRVHTSEAVIENHTETYVCISTYQYIKQASDSSLGANTQVKLLLYVTRDRDMAVLPLHWRTCVSLSAQAGMWPYVSVYMLRVNVWSVCMICMQICVYVCV